LWSIHCCRKYFDFQAIIFLTGRGTGLRHASKRKFDAFFSVLKESRFNIETILAGEPVEMPPISSTPASEPNQGKSRDIFRRATNGGPLRDSASGGLAPEIVAD